MSIPFNKPFLTGKELTNIADVYARGHFSWDGFYTKKCNEWMEKNTGASSALLTNSCTAALEMASILIDIEPEDEVIMPSYTFVSTANAFVLRGAVPVFIDIRADTLNMDEKLIEEAISNKTKAIIPVHYAGVACEMDTIIQLAKNNDLKVIEDAAQALNATYKGCALGTIGDLGAYSFHETKNIVSGEGGGLLVNNLKHKDRSEIIREKGTNRSSFLRKEVEKYTWVDKGSSYLPGEIIAAFLFAQMEEVENITRRRLELWELYHQLLEELESSGVLRRPIVPNECQHNAHMYYVLLNNQQERDSLMLFLKDKGIQAVFHYIPLHNSPAGKSYSRYVGEMTNTERVSETILRLPMYVELASSGVTKVVDAISDWSKLKL